MPDAEDRLALQAWCFLANGAGGIDWAGLPIVAAHLGITDVDGLMHRLYTLRTYTPQTAKT
jgi:hypothetical protein